MKPVLLSIIAVLVVSGVGLVYAQDLNNPEAMEDAQPQRIDSGVEDGSDHHLPTVLITTMRYGDESQAHIFLRNMGYEPIDVTDWYVKTNHGGTFPISSHTTPTEPISVCDTEDYWFSNNDVSRTGTGFIAHSSLQLTLYDNNDNKIDKTSEFSISRTGQASVKAFAPPMACAGTSHTDTVWISEVEANPGTQDDRGREWVVLTNGQDEEVNLEDWELIGSTASYTIEDAITIPSCGSHTLRLNDAIIANEGERLLLIDNERKLVDRTPYFTDDENNDKTIKYEPPKCADSLDDISTPETDSLYAKVERFESMLDGALDRITALETGTPVPITPSNGNQDLTALENKVTTLETKTTALERMVNTIQRTLDSISTSITGILDRLTALETGTPTPTPPTPPPPTSIIGIEGKVFNDANNNNYLDMGESGISNSVVLVISLANPSNVNRITTDSNGDYSIELSVGSGWLVQVEGTNVYSYVTVQSGAPTITNLGL